jgi:hypothetical protein
MKKRGGTITIVKTTQPDMLVDVKLRLDGKTMTARTKVHPDRVGRAACECLADFFLRQKGIR